MGTWSTRNCFRNGPGSAVRVVTRTRVASEEAESVPGVASGWRGGTSRTPPSPWILSRSNRIRTT
jgi:hypothetical protein